MENYENREPDQNSEAQEPLEETAPVEETVQQELAPAPEEAEEHTRFEINTEPVSEQTEETPRKKRKSGRVLKAVVAALLLIAIGSSITAVACYGRLAAQEKRTEQLLGRLEQKIDDLEEELDSKSFTGNGNSISGSANSTADGSLTPGQVYAQTVDSVVFVTSKTVSDGTVATATGTGFVLSEDGYIVTNYHVVGRGTILTVTTNDGDEYPALLRGYDATNDIAVLKVEAEGLKPVKLGSSDDLIVGDQVAVVGNPLGELTFTLTVGYVSGKDRIISTDGSMINMLQTDAAVNAGNSGGPIFNMKGEVVGIITAKYSGTTTSGASIEGIGFAIPIDDVQRKIWDLVEYGYVTGAYLGVMVQDMDLDVAEYYGLPLGVYVSEAVEGYCAKAAGVQSKDIIIALGDYSVTCTNDLTRALQNFKGGDETTITVWRGGREIVLDITLDEKPH